MANTKQALKRARQARAHRQGNRWQVSRANTQIKTVLTAVDAKDVERAKGAYQHMCSLLDRLANKGIIHRNKAARHKSRVSARIAQLEKA